MTTLSAAGLLVGMGGGWHTCQKCSPMPPEGPNMASFWRSDRCINGDSAPLLSRHHSWSPVPKCGSQMNSVTEAWDVWRVTSAHPGARGCFESYFDLGTRVRVCSLSWEPFKGFGLLFPKRSPETVGFLQVSFSSKKASPKYVLTWIPFNHYHLGKGLFSKEATSLVRLRPPEANSI